ncbi:MAG: YibE/F family protein [Dehalococcoidia bacterium]|nr:MAG: YibE/F family protein [Dehalococcoidia bacterium]
MKIKSIGRAKWIWLILIVLMFGWFSGGQVFGQEMAEKATEETLETRVTEVVKEEEIADEYGSYVYQNLELLVTKGSLEGESIYVENGSTAFANSKSYEKGDRLLVSYVKSVDESEYFYIVDYYRADSLLKLFLVFVILAVLVAGWKGVSSVVGMGLSFVVIFKFILPRILNGADPIFVSVLGACLIIPISFYVSHGFSKKTTVAIAGTIISLILTGLLAGIFVDILNISGFASEEAGFLSVEMGGNINMRGILLAGIVVSALGILDDITISQTSIAYQLKKANPELNWTELNRKAMEVGRDHIASMINSLVLVYAGASLPLLLLFVNNPHPFSEVINYEIVADEIVRTLVGSIGLILAVPITTLIASAVLSDKNKV